MALRVSPLANDIMTRFNQGMKLKTLFVALTCLLLLAACAPSTTDLSATAEILAQTMVAGTQGAQLTQNSLLNPTSISTLEVIPSPTVTFEPSETPTEEPTATQVIVLATSAIVDTYTDPNSQPGGSKSRVLLQNDTEERIVLTISGDVYAEYVFTDTFLIYLSRGDYSVLAFIGDNGPFSASFTITNLDKYIIEFDLDRMKVHLP